MPSTTRSAPRPKPFRFFASASHLTGKQVGETARRAEAAGYDAMLIADHLRDSLGPLAFMGYAAAVTNKLKLGNAVLNNDLRHPVVLAQELAAIDQLSDGRLIVGIGAGWKEIEYTSAGIHYDSPGVRIERLGESLQILKQIFQGPVEFSGKHYTVEGFEQFVRPVQRPHPPFMIGGGARRSLSLAAREGDIVGLTLRMGPGGTNDLETATSTATDQKLDWVREAAGDRFDDLQLHTVPMFDAARITDDGRPLLRRLIDRHRTVSGQELTEDEVDDSPHVFVGSLDHVVEKLEMVRERWGINIVTLDDPFGSGNFDEFAPVIERLAGR
jgi:probable F420-dependent oxidoreductase